MRYLLAFVVLGGVALGVYVASGRRDVAPIEAAPVPASEEMAPAENVELTGLQTVSENGARRSAVDAEIDAPEDDVEEERVSVRVHTTTSFMRDADHVPHVAFEVYRSPSVLPSVGARSSDPAHPYDTPLAVGRTDGEGEALVSMPTSSLPREPTGLVQLYARVVEPGYQARFGGHAAWRKDPDGLDALCVMAVPGATLRCRVVDTDAAPVRAKVQLMDWVTPEGVRQLRWAGAGRALLDGWFEVDVREPVDDAVLVAMTDKGGTGALRGLSFGLGDAPRDLEVVISGPGSLRGRVVDEAGQPAAGVELGVGIVELDSGKGFVSPEPLYSERRAEGGGHLVKQLVTDSDGRFEAVGLRGDLPFVVRARTGQGDSWDYPTLLTEEPVPADGRSLELTLSRSHLAVEVFDAKGEPWSMSRITIRNDASFMHLHEWPGAPAVVVYPCEPAGGEAVVRGDAIDGKVVGTSQAVFDVPDGARYLVGAVGGPFPGPLQVVEVLPGAGRVPVRVVAPQRARHGAVSVRVEHEGRELMGYGRGEPSFDVYLEARGTAAILLVCERYKAPPFVLRAPPGAYRVVVEGTPDFAYHGDVRAEREWGRTEVDIEILSGNRHELVLELEPGGRIELLLEGEALEADRQAVVGTYDGVHDPNDPDQHGSQAASASVELLRSGRRPETVYRKIGTADSVMGAHLVSSWHLGRESTSEILPTGSFTLVARMPGGREVRAPVEIESGETTRVTLRFRP